jgi:N-acetylglutamate synthase-like GNAT family acetyltransferase
MTISHNILLEAIETSLYLLPELPGRVEWLHIPGLRGRITAVSDFFANLVGAATLDNENADRTIQQVFNLFTSQNKEFGWIIGPRSTPTDLSARLLRLGMELDVEMAGMALTDLSVPIPINPEVRIREATPADLEPASRLLAPALGVGFDGAHVVTESLLLSPSRLHRRVYLAFLPKVDEPVAYASTVHLPDQTVAVLFCAATAEAYRGRGIYTSLVARRLADAQRDGAQAAVIQAVRQTSAPICSKLGFKELGELVWFNWFPK